MLYLQILLTVTYLFFCKKISHKLLSNVLAFFVLILSIQLIGNLYDYDMVNHISNYTILIFNMNIIFFITGAYIFSTKIKKIINTKSIQLNIKQIKNITNIKKLIVIQLTLLIIAYYYYSKFDNLITSVSENEHVRGLFFETNFLFKSYTEQFFYTYILSSYKYVASFIFSLLFIQTSKDKFEILLMLISIIFIYLLSIISQSRGDIITPLLYVYFLYQYVISTNKLQYIKNIKFKVLLLTFISFISIGSISLLRIKDEITIINFINSFNDTVIIPVTSYLTFPITAFEYGINQLFFDTPLMLGAATFAGLEELLLLPFEFIFKGTNTTNSFLSSKMSIFYNINGTNWNALYTGVLNYYLDFNILGVVIIPIILGYLLGKLSFLVSKSTNVSYLIFYLFYLYCLFKNLMSSPFQSLEAWTGLLMIFAMHNVIYNIRKLKNTS